MYISLRDLFQGISSYDYEASKSEICRAGWQAGNSPAGAEAAVLRQNFFRIPQFLQFSRREDGPAKTSKGRCAPTHHHHHILNDKTPLGQIPMMNCCVKEKKHFLAFGTWSSVVSSELTQL